MHRSTGEQAARSVSGIGNRFRGAGAQHTLEAAYPLFSRHLLFLSFVSSFSSAPLPPLTKTLPRSFPLFFHLFNSPPKKRKNSDIDVTWGIPALQSPPAEKLGPVKATVGDTVVFKWSGGLSYALYQISKREFRLFLPLCFSRVFV